MVACGGVYVAAFVESCVCVRVCVCGFVYVGSCVCLFWRMCGWGEYVSACE